MARLHEAIEDLAALNGFPDEEKAGLQRCLEEAITMIVRKGFDDGGAHTISVQFQFQADTRTLVVRIIDDGRALDLLDEESVETRDAMPPGPPPSGLGLYLTRTYADHVSHYRGNSCNHLVLSRQIARRRTRRTDAPRRSPRRRRFRLR